MLRDLGFMHPEIPSGSDGTATFFSAQINSERDIALRVRCESVSRFELGSGLQWLQVDRAPLTCAHLLLTSQKRPFFRGNSRCALTPPSRED